MQALVVPGTFIVLIQLWPWLVFDLSDHELFVVTRALGSLRPTDEKSSAGMALVIGDFGPKVEYFPFEQGSGTSRRRLKSPRCWMFLVMRTCKFNSFTLLFC